MITSTWLTFYTSKYFASYLNQTDLSYFLFSESQQVGKVHKMKTKALYLVGLILYQIKGKLKINYLIISESQIV